MGISLLAVLIAGCLLAAALAKAHAGVPAFARALRAFIPVPQSLERVVAQSVIAAEALTGILLLTPFRVFGALLAIGLFAAFAFAVSGALVGSARPPCGCFGVLAPWLRVSPALLACDLTLLAAAIYVASGSSSALCSLGFIPFCGAFVAVGMGLQSARALLRPRVRRT